MQHGDGVDHQQPGLKQRVQRERHGPAAGTEGGKGSEREGREGKGPAAERDVAGRGGAGRDGPAGAGTKWRPRPAVAMEAAGGRGAGMAPRCCLRE